MKISFEPVVSYTGILMNSYNTLMAGGFLTNGRGLAK